MNEKKPNRTVLKFWQMKRYSPASSEIHGGWCGCRWMELTVVTNRRTFRPKWSYYHLCQSLAHFNWSARVCISFFSLVLCYFNFSFRQGLTWILKREKQNGLVVTKVDDKYFLQQLEDCLTNGKPMLIELTDEEVDPILDPLLDKQIIKSGRSYKIVISDKEMDYNESFRVFWPILKLIRLFTYSYMFNYSKLTYFFFCSFTSPRG